MIVVELHEDVVGQPVWFRVMGHAGFDAKGRDIVCAGISAIAQTTLGALRDIVRIPGAFTDNEQELVVDPEWLNMGISSDQNRRADALLKAAWYGFTELARVYPGHLVVNTVRDG